MLVVKKQCQCINTDECAELGAQSYPDESVLGRTEVLFSGWVHKITLESVLGRTEVLFSVWVHKFTLESVLGRTEVLFVVGYTKLP